MLLSAVPPLCIVGWASPLMTAGVLFPCTAWFGLAAVVAFPAQLLNVNTRVVAVLTAGMASLVLNAENKLANIPKGWEAEMMRTHRQHHDDALAEFLIEERLQRVVMQSHSRFLVFPETAVRHWTEATSAFWSPILRATQKTVLIGAGQPIPGTSQYYNSVVIVGKETREPVHQRIPVPGGMESIPAERNLCAQSLWFRHGRCRWPACCHSNLL